jgi:hypothetical protein
MVKVKVIPQQAEVAQGVPGRLKPRIFLTFGTTRVVGRQPYAPAAFTPGEIPGYHFQRLSRTQGTWFRRKPRKKSPVTPQGIDPVTSRLAAQCLNHYATPGPFIHGGTPKIQRCNFTYPVEPVSVEAFEVQNPLIAGAQLRYS